jgi:phage tail sheath protein FI
MPSALTYPGVYVEEIPSGVRTITGVATSIAAFVGRTRQGLVGEPVVVTNYGDFERQFGGLWFASPMTYAVRDFFANGGAQAVIVRGFNAIDPAVPPPAPGSPPAPVPDGKAHVLADPKLTLEASSPGKWGNALRTRIVTQSTEVAPGDTSLFNLYVAMVRLDTTGKPIEISDVEVFRNVSLLQNHARRIDNVLKVESKLVRAVSFTPSTDPAVKPTGVTPLVGSEAWSATASIGVTDAGGNVPAGGVAGSDGFRLTRASLTGGDTASTSTGLYALDRADQFNMLCIPPHDRDGHEVESDLIDDAVAYCQKRRAIMLIDPPSGWKSRTDAVDGVTQNKVGVASANAALFFPRIRRPDPDRPTVIDDFSPSGAVAGVIARTDVERGVWKAPAGQAATLVGVPDLSVKLTEGDIGLLNPLGVNCLRSMPNLGNVVWGSRTRMGADALASEWKYLPVRRLTLFIEESLYRGTHWVVFEPNDEPLWAAIRLNVGAFMHTLFRQGAFQGQTARQAYEVKCDAETTTQDDINRGVVNIVVRFAPLKPAEFVVIKIQQLAGQVQA